MAGDWIKMRTNLWDDPRVAAICDRVDASESAVIGGLYRLWTIADGHSTDGSLVGMTAASLDRKVGMKGFAEALVAVGWIGFDDAGASIPRFDEHNGASAKQRAKNAKRMASARNVHKSRTDDAQVANADRTDDARSAELEKEKEKIDSPNGESPPKPPKGGGESRKVSVSELKLAEQVYAVYPRKIARDQALKAIALALRRVGLDELIDATREYARSREGKDPNLTPYPASWFNAGRWTDDRREWFRQERSPGTAGQRPRAAGEDFRASSSTEDRSF